MTRTRCGKLDSIIIQWDDHNMAIGPRHEYPLGTPINERDQGRLCAAFRTVKQSRVGVMQFGTVVSWLAGNPMEMAALAGLIRADVYRDFGRLPYDKGTLPIRVVVNQQRRVIELYLPKEMDILVANPEMWLALAETIDSAVKRLVPH